MDPDELAIQDWENDGGAIAPVTCSRVHQAASVLVIELDTKPGAELEALTGAKNEKI